MWFDFHMQNLKHLCYEIPNFALNDKEKQTKLEAALSHLSENLAANFLLTDKNLPST